MRAYWQIFFFMAKQTKQHFLFWIIKLIFKVHYVNFGEKIFIGRFFFVSFMSKQTR